MRSEREQQIIAKYPQFFERVPKGYTRMRFLLECSSGWFDLVEEALEKLQALEITDLYILQIKEKFGGLRIYTSQTNKEIRQIIAEAEDKASQTCEVCSKPGELCRKDYWYRTLCHYCAKDNHYKAVPKDDDL